MSVLAVTAAVVPLGITNTAEAARAGVVASYGAGKINLAKGWGSAQSCVVTRTATTCYTSNAAADAALGVTPTVAAAVPACAWTYLCLWDLPNGGGRRLIFRDEGWQSLVPYGFDKQTESWRNNQPCSDQAILGDGRGSVLTLGDCAYGASMGAWANRAVDVGA